MTDAPPRNSRQPKFRASCDGCGSAKLKCDRGHPECGRCILLGMPCIYGTSKKMGKPPRQGIRMHQASDVPQKRKTPSEDRGISMPDEKPSDGASSQPRGVALGAFGDNQVSTSKPLLDPSNEHFDFNGLLAGTDAMFNDRLGPALFTSLECGEWVLSGFHDPNKTARSYSETDGISALGLTSPAGGNTAFPSAPLGPLTLQTQHEELGQIGTNPPALPQGAKHHDCSREVVEILNAVSLIDTSRTRPKSQSPITSNGTHQIPLDYMLRLNRESIEGLGHLLKCPCYKAPHLMLLCASTISRIMLWYQDASCNSSWQNINLQEANNTSATELGLYHIPPPTSTIESSPSSTMTGATDANASGTNTPVVARTAILPAAMAVGSFNVDDQSVELALRIQLLLGELRRTGSLIDLFASQGCSRASGCVQNSTYGLYKSLGLWLKDEHTRIADAMKASLESIT